LTLIILKSVCFYILFYNKRDKYFILKIHSLFILKKTGLCLYSRNFTEEFDNLDVNLISPFFSAIFSFSSDIIQRKLEELEMAGLRFNFKVFKDFIFVILADSSMSLLFVRTRLDSIVSVFFKVYDSWGDLEQYKEIENFKFDNLIDSIITGEEEAFKSRDIYQKIIDHFKNLLFENEIIGAALLSTTGNIIYTSLPTDILLTSLKELEIRFMSGATSLPEMFYALENGQKVFSSIIHVSKQISFLIVLLFESSVPLGMCEINLKNVAKKIKKLI